MSGRAKGMVVSGVGESEETSNEDARMNRAGARFGWLTQLLSAGLMGVLIIVVRLLVQGESSAADWFNFFNVGALVVAIACAFAVVRAGVKGKPWRNAFPTGYGALGFAVLVAAALADVCWREGVEDRERFAASLAPTRILIFVGPA